jgi:hypothetical protein
MKNPSNAVSLAGLAVLLLLAGCATGSSGTGRTTSWHERFATSHGHSGSAGDGPQVVWAASASKGSPSTRIGWVYRIEGHLDGQPVQYIGSAADLKQRLSGQHKWAKLLQQADTKVYAMEVFAELDVQASNRRTLMSARNEALRAAEQRVLDQVKEKSDKTATMRGDAGKKEPRILNEINASQDTAAWEMRHKVVASGEWRLFERRLGRVEISSEEFREWRKEAEAKASLHGT